MFKTPPKGTFITNPVNSCRVMFTCHFVWCHFSLMCYFFPQEYHSISGRFVFFQLLIDKKNHHPSDKRWSHIGHPRTLYHEEMWPSGILQQLQLCFVRIPKNVRISIRSYVWLALNLATKNQLELIQHPSTGHPVGGWTTYLNKYELNWIISRKKVFEMPQPSP